MHVAVFKSAPWMVFEHYEFEGPAKPRPSNALNSLVHHPIAVASCQPLDLIRKGVGGGARGGGEHNFHDHPFPHQVGFGLNLMTGTVRTCFATWINTYCIIYIYNILYVYIYTYIIIWTYKYIYIYMYIYIYIYIYVYILPTFNCDISNLVWHIQVAPRRNIKLRNE